MAKTPEFDQFARDYSGGNDDPIKRMFGKNFDQFTYVKAKWFWNYIQNNLDKAILNENCKLLDYGCGTGEMLKWLKLLKFPGKLYGADVSEAMLVEAEKRWDVVPKPLFSCIGETKTDFLDNSFSFVVATVVFHHIDPDKRDAVLREIKRILIPGGILAIFEHNPFNPMTRLIVKRAVIDKNAKLLYPRETRNRINKASFTDSILEYIMFFPPNMKTLHRFEKYLTWFPLGAQYVVLGRK
jgi:ubiquinone/menaquinone biosynthesis C-methylase UbiE